MKKEFLKSRSGKISGKVLRLCAVLFSLAVMTALAVTFVSVGERLGVMSLLLTVPQAGKSISYENGSYFFAENGVQKQEQDSGVSDAENVSGSESQTSKPSGDEIINLAQKDEAGVYKTPDDITELIEKAEKEAENQTKAGGITEAQYVSGKPYVGYEDLWFINTTGITLDVKALYSKKPNLSIKNDGTPAVLIYHTHTCESYVDLDNGWYSTAFTSRSEDKGRNMVRVGDAIAQELENAGIGVIHDTEIYDRSYNGSYQRSRAQAELYLKLYPSIKITLDVHRDALENSDGTVIKPVAEINGKKAAQIMIIAGREGGSITSFPDWENNLSFAVQIQNKVNEMYAGLMRPIFHCYRMYNMDLTPNSLLIEVGTHGNTLDEAVYSGTLFGKALSEMLKGYIC